MGAEDEEWETRAEAAKAIRHSVRTVDRLLEDRTLKGLKLGRKHLVSVASRKAFMAKAEKAQEAGRKAG
jgi:excisionase family DNA binding protein